MKLMTLKWSDPYEVKQQGKRKLVKVRTARFPTANKEAFDRFHLYQTNAGMIPSMWTLFDSVTGSQHFLHAMGEDNALTVASERIREELASRRTLKRALIGKPLKGKKT